MNYSLESFVEYCEFNEVAEESRKPRKWNSVDRAFYKIDRKLQTNKVALNIDLSRQQKLLKKEYEQALEDDALDQFYAKVEKWKIMMQRKINGKEIKDKKSLQKFITLYDEYLNKRSSANESFFDTLLDDEYDIAEEGKIGDYLRERERMKKEKAVMINNAVKIQKPILLKITKDFINTFNTNSRGKAPCQYDISEKSMDKVYNNNKQIWLQVAVATKLPDGFKSCFKTTLQDIKEKYVNEFRLYNTDISFSGSIITISMKLKTTKEKASESFFDLIMNNDMEIAQEKLTVTQRKALPNNAFGLPKLRKYPLIIQDEKTGEYDWSHLRNAIAYFGACKDEELKKELARNIAKTIKKYNVEVKISPNNQIRKYAKFD